ncbi:hypothetical protein N0V90_009938 [Kalmusia sp. IMI 367209]|nr:hypothetical protein N0V90_009938 [Kalmusia sp. IMI 367209]
MTATTAAIEDEILAEYDYPKGLWARFVHQVCKISANGHMTEKEKRRKFPLALLSPGLNTTRFFTNHLAQELASRGFTVITIDHPYDTDVVEFPNGDIIIGGRVTKENASLEHALQVRADDASFILNNLGMSAEDETAVMFGQSFGGAATATALLNDKRFRAGVNIDGLMFGPVLTTPLGKPTRPQAFMLWGSDGHEEYPSWTQFQATLSNSTFVDYWKHFNIVNSTHGSYWDLNILVDIAGIRGGLSETAQLLIGPVPGARVWDIVGRYLSEFFWYTLGLKLEDEILKRPSAKFPEVNALYQ